LLVKPAGKYWRYDYRHGGKRKTLALGVYPSVSLAAARKGRDEARSLLDQGVDPGEARKAKKEALFTDNENSFEVVAREWHARQSAGWVPSHSVRILARLENDVFPWIGKKPVADLLAPDLLAVVRRVEGRGAGETAHRVLQNIGQVLRYAVITGRADRDVSADLRGALAPVRGKNLAAIVEPAKVGPLLRMLDSYEGSFIVASALRLAPLVFVRPGELQKYL
jgi:integrase